ncbi:MAG: hypothetical protein LBD45_03920 [Bacteroidales bacterium]|nr:hypothetical protein [Bacteroidales bacterium]
MASIFSLPQRFLTRKGYGVHSPFAFYLLTKILPDEYSYYAFVFLDEYIRSVDIYLHARNICFKIFKPAYYHFLFRLGVYFRWKTILSLGDSFGLSLLYTSMGSGSLFSYSYYSQHGLLVDLLGDISLSRLAQTTSAEDFHDTLSSIDKVDCLLFSQFSVGQQDYLELFNLIKSKLHANSCMIIEKISSKPMQVFWEELIFSQDVSAVFDFYDTGVVFFNKKYVKRLYKVLF